ncbi:bifunctional N(6)-L-threonylcarbamoyladenine synthase/serine/threonine protein kinase [Candidatus Woesearchaeota archaeon]|nr:bifunctional N(6)-L-threonylcarbamoyladenine synthase/serine/threonine protein kinase [Candidatus Woesearchaeota archaeon]MBW3014096.1 bifunctional N(6)-L-threonylcarbamoyladenine synthase/serine/threonine protein kinase [Candidatus Woesearchaeota archaeon]
MICLGIESTAHTFGAAVIKSKKVLSNVKDSFTTKTGGIIPNKAAEHHIDVCDEVIQRALKEAKVEMKDIELVAFSNAPGLGPCLRVGAIAARSLALANNIPIIGVNHCIAHLEIGKMLTDAKDPVLLYASGANTQVIAFDGGKYRIFGETLDIGVGNLLDSFARHIGLGFPGGPKLDKLSTLSKNYIELPYAVKGMDVSFGGILTNLKQKFDSGKFKEEDLAFSLQETIFAMLLEVSERAMAHCDKNELLLGGGVACNKRLQEMAHQMCKDRGARCFVPEMQFLVDNAAMIAWLGLLEYKHGRRQKLEETTIKPYERTDEVDVLW